MNRLSPLIVRRVGPLAPALPIALEESQSDAAPDALGDLKMFVTVWLGGLVFFGTFLS